MLLQDIIYDIRNKKAEKVQQQDYINSSVLRDLEVTILTSFAKTIEFVRGDIEEKEVYLNRILDGIIKYNIEFTDDEAYNLCINYKNDQYIQRVFKLKMLNGTK